MPAVRGAGLGRNAVLHLRPTKEHGGAAVDNAQRDDQRGKPFVRYPRRRSMPSRRTCHSSCPSVLSSSSSLALLSPPHLAPPGTAPPCTAYDAPVERPGLTTRRSVQPQVRAKQEFAHGGIALEDGQGRQTIFSSTVDVFASNGVMHVLLDVMRAPELVRLCVPPSLSLRCVFPCCLPISGDESLSSVSHHDTLKPNPRTSVWLVGRPHSLFEEFCPLKDRASGGKLAHKASRSQFSLRYYLPQASGVDRSKRSVF
jgi:hypothetical protein